YGADADPAKDPKNHYFCVKVGAEFILIKVTDYVYQKDMITNRPNGGSMTFTWKWISHSPAYAGYDPVNLTTHLEGVDRVGSGYNFLQNNYEFRKYDIYVADLDATTGAIKEPIYQLTNDNDIDRFPCFSPSSSDIVYFTHGTAADRYMSYEFPGDPADSNIYMMSVNGGAMTKVTNGNYDRYCSFSPSGKYFAFSRYDGTNYDLRLADYTGGTDALLADTGGNDIYPSFSPMGDKVAFQSDVTIDTDIFTVVIDGTGLLNITNNNSINDSMPAWTP
ncbi:MAG TPA: hypothetical protein PLQ76_07770, partial [bacterium]|nr:hypothetical protein [bacterium]